MFLRLVGEAWLKGKKTMNDVIKAHEYSSYNYEAFRNDTACGCFYCGKIFSYAEINDWTPEPDGSKTALCPYCGIDSVIGESSGYPITEEFLEEMKKYWF